MIKTNQNSTEKKRYNLYYTKYNIKSSKIRQEIDFPFN